MNKLHHEEQMEAARRDFERVWEQKLFPRLQVMGKVTDNHTMGAFRDIAWTAFRAGQETGNK